MCAYLRGLGRLRAIIDIDGRNNISEGLGSSSRNKLSRRRGRLKTLRRDGSENVKEDKELHGWWDRC